MEIKYWLIICLWGHCLPALSQDTLYVQSGDTLLVDENKVDQPTLPYKDTSTYRGNNLFIGFAGNGSLIGINYEHVFYRNQKIFLSGNLGVGLTSNIRVELDFWGAAPSESRLAYTTTSQWLFNYADGKQVLSAGVGVSAVHARSRSSAYYPFPIIAFGHYERHGNYRLFASFPLTVIDNDDFLWIPLGISVAFNL